MAVAEAAAMAMAEVTVMAVAEAAAMAMEGAAAMEVAVGEMAKHHEWGGSKPTSELYKLKKDRRHIQN